MRRAESLGAVGVHNLFGIYIGGANYERMRRTASERITIAATFHNLAATILGNSAGSAARSRRCHLAKWAYNCEEGK
jgi:hypothetical protein